MKNHETPWKYRDLSIAAGMLVVTFVLVVFDWSSRSAAEHDLAQHRIIENQLVTSSLKGKP